MKSILALIMLSSSVSLAAVDYVKIGELSKKVNADLTYTTQTAACYVENYSKKPDCKAIEKLNNALSKLSNSDIDYVDGCVNFSSASSVGWISSDARKLRQLAYGANESDAVWAVIEKVERSIEKLKSDLNEASQKLRLQETYVSQCLFGIEPTPVSIKDLLCK